MKLDRLRVGTSHGLQLIALITGELPRLSPSMQSIGSYCVSARGRLHLLGIEEVAAACGTAPASVVRFAKHFGCRGYRDLRTAFLGRESLPDDPRGSTPELPHRPIDAGLARLLCHLDEDVARLAELREMVTSDAFRVALCWIRQTPRITLTFRGEFDRLMAIHLGNTLQRANKQVLLTDRMPAAKGAAGEADGVVIHCDLECTAPSPRGTGPGNLTAAPRVVTLQGVKHPSHTPPGSVGLSLAIAGSSLGCRLQKALSLAPLIEAALV